MLNRSLLVSAIALTIGVSGVAVADYDGGFKFRPLDESANAADFDPAAPWKLPRG